MNARIAQKLLAEKMSDISERCWYAGWLFGTEYILWQAVLEGPQRWGHSTITDEDIATLKALAKEAGGWIMFNDLGPEDELFVPQDRWEQIYANWRTPQQQG